MVKAKVQDNGSTAVLDQAIDMQDLDPTNPQDPSFKGKPEQVRIKPLRERVVIFHIRGLAPYLQLRFSKKALETMMKQQTAEQKSNATKKAERKPRNYSNDYKEAQYVPLTGGGGIPAAAFRNASVSACRVCGFAMTLAKLSIFVEPDDFDKLDHTPLVKITKGKPETHIGPARNANFSTDLRVRAIWPEWEAKVRVRFDEDQFSLTDVANLFTRVGRQVGVGEGRPDSRKSCGMGLGLFEIIQITGVKA